MSNNMADRRGWHFDKSYTLILATLSLLGGLGYQYASFSARLAVLENAQATVTMQLTQILANQERTDARQDAQIVSIHRDMRDTYLRIDDNIRTLLERRTAK